MNFLSKEKLNRQKNKKKMTNLKIAQLSKIPLSNIDKIFSGVNKNPTLDTIQKIAQVLECSIDDFIEYEIPPISPVYIDKKTQKITDVISGNEHLKDLLGNFLQLKNEDIKIIETLVKRFKK